MPLSEHEQRLLEQMERALYAEDPKFASALRGANARARYRRRAVVAGVGFLAGVALLVVGAVTAILLSVLGFVVMLAAGLVAISSWRQIPPAGEVGAGAPKRSRTAARSTAGFMSRLEERWNRRREDDGR